MKKGDIFIFTSGEYELYGVHDLYEVIDDFNIEDLKSFSDIKNLEGKKIKPINFYGINYDANGNFILEEFK